MIVSLTEKDYGPIYKALPTCKKKWLRHGIHFIWVDMADTIVETSDVDYFYVTCRDFEESPHDIIIIEFILCDDPKDKNLLKRTCVEQLRRVIYFAFNSGGGKINCC